MNLEGYPLSMGRTGTASIQNIARMEIRVSAVDLEPLFIPIFCLNAYLSNRISYLIYPILYLLLLETRALFITTPIHHLFFRSTFPLPSMSADSYSKIKVIPNMNYQRSGPKSYVYLMQNGVFSPPFLAHTSTLTRLFDKVLVLAF